MTPVLRNLEALKGPHSAGQSWNVMEKESGDTDTQFLGQRHLESIFSGPPFCSHQEPRLRRKMRRERGSVTEHPPFQAGPG